MSQHCHRAFMSMQCRSGTMLAYRARSGRDLCTLTAPGEYHMHTGIAESKTHHTHKTARRSGGVCPSLVLFNKVVCDSWGPLHEPGKAQVREFCTTELHIRCSRRSLGAALQQADALPAPGLTDTGGRLALRHAAPRDVRSPRTDGDPL